jgi:squalene-hopene/tetraprenyl-beta-curcumene cyclase
MAGKDSASSVEETALAVEAMLGPKGGNAWTSATARGLQWLVDAVLADRHRESSPIGFYFAKLWYYESQYPLTFTVSALGRAVARLGSQTTITH